MAIETFADVGLVRFSRGTSPVGAGFIVDDRHIVTCAHVVNAALGRPLGAAERPDAVGPVAVRVGGDWIPVEVTLAAWIPPSEDRRGDVAVLEMTAGRPAGAGAVPLRRPQQSEDRRFAVQGFPDGTLIGATGVIRARLTIGQEWAQLEDDKQAGRAVTEGFSGAPIWDTTVNAVVGMAIAKDARAPDAKIAAMLPVPRLAGYWPPLAYLVPSRLALDPRFDTYWDARARGVENAHVPGTYFTGRRRALTELVEWLVADPHPADNLRVVSGGPGSGKSGVLARLVTASDPGFRRRHPPASDDPLHELPEGTVDVAVQARDLDPTQLLQALAEGVDFDATDVDALVAALAAHGRPVTLVVDGLDESTRPKQAAAVLRRAAGDTAELGVRLLVGTRPGPQTKLLRALGASAARNAINLDDTTYLEKADLAEYVRRRLLLEGVPADRLVHDTPYRGHHRLAETVAAGVADRAYPSFLIAALTAVGLVRSGAVVNVEVDGWDQFPTTVAAAMDDYLDRFDQDRDRVEDLLRPLAYSYGAGLPPDELWAGLAVRLAGPGRTYTEIDIRWLLDTAADYLLEATSHTGSGTAYRLYHQALTDRLRDQDPAGGGPVEEGAYELLLDSVPRSPRGDADWERAHPYIRTHLADHAAATGHLGDLVSDPAFLLAADPTALTASLRQSPRITNPGARAYRMAAHLLADPSDRLFQLQLYAARLGETTLERQLAAHAVSCRPRLAWTHERRYTPHYTLGRHTDVVLAVAIGKLDGRPVVVSGSGDSTVRVWDLATGDQVGDPFTGHTGGLTAVAVGKLDGHPIVVSGGGDSRVRVWHLATGDPVGDPLTGHTGRVSAVAVGELDGRPIVVSGGRDSTVRVWDLGTGDPVGDPLTGHTGRVLAVAVGELDGHPIVVSGGGDSTVRVWDLGTGDPVGDPLTGHTGRVAAVAVAELYGHPIVVSGGDDSTLRVWDLATGNPVGDPFTGHTGRILAVAVAELYGRPLVVSGGDDSTVRVWDLGTGDRVGDPLTGHTGWVTAVAAGELDGRPLVVSGGDDSTVRVWDLGTGDPVGDPLTGHTGGVFDTAVAVGELDGRPIVVSRGLESTVRVWDLAAGDPVGQPFTGDTGWVKAVAVGELDGRPVVVSGGLESTLRVWDLGTGDQVGDPFTGHTGRVTAVAVGELHGRPIVVSGGDDSTLRVWDLATGDPVGDPLTGHTGRILAVAAGELHGRPIVVSGGDDSTLRVWDLATGNPVGDPLTGHTGRILAVAAGELHGRPVLVSGGDDSTLRVWDLATGDPVGDPFIGHTGGVSAVAVAELDGRPIVVSGGDSTVRVWDLGTGGNPCVIRLDVSVQSVTKPQNDMVVIGHAAGLTAVRI